MLNNRQIQLLENFVKKVYDKANADYQSFDTKAFIDPELSYQENKQILKEKLKELGVLEEEVSAKQVKETAERYNKEQIQLEIKHNKLMLDKEIEKIKNSSIVELDQYFKPLTDLIEIIVKSEKPNGLVVVGRRGFGKSFNTIKKLTELKTNFVIVKGHITGLSFYKLLYENKDKTILIDDILNLLKNEDILSMLLGAMDYDNRLVRWQSESPLARDLPSDFLFEGKIITLFNQIPETASEYIDAFKDRCFFIELDFDNTTILKMMYIMAKKKNIPLEVVDYLKERARESMKNLSLRLLDKFYALYNNGDSWKELADSILEYDEREDFVLELLKSGKKVSEQVKLFVENGYGCRATYFIYKKKLKRKLKKSKSL